MNTFNPENIPSYIFDWLEKFSFLSLNQEQQKEVLKYFSEEEYDELHKSCLSIKSNYEPFLSYSSYARKQDLLGRFEARSEKKRKFALIILPHALWKVAASILLIGCGWSLHYFIPANNKTDNSLVTVIDTFFVSKEVVSDPIKIYDTVYLVKETSKSLTKKDTHYTKTSHITPTTENQTFYYGEISNKLNSQKRNSIKDDSLMKEFPVTIL